MPPLPSQHILLAACGLDRRATVWGPVPLPEPGTTSAEALVRAAPPGSAELPSDAKAAEGLRALFEASQGQAAQAPRKPGRQPKQPLSGIIKELGHGESRGFFQGVTFSACGGQLATAGADRSVKVYQVNDPYAGGATRGNSPASSAADHAAKAAAASRRLLAPDGSAGAAEAGNSGRGILREIASLSTIGVGAGAAHGGAPAGGAKSSSSSASSSSSSSSSASASASSQPAATRRLFCDDTLRSFVRRLAFSPDASLLLCPAAELSGASAAAAASGSGSTGQEQAVAAASASGTSGQEGKGKGKQASGADADASKEMDGAGPALPPSEQHRYGVAVYNRRSLLPATGAAQSVPQSGSQDPSVLLPVGSASAAVVVRCCPALLKAADSDGSSPGSDPGFGTRDGLPFSLPYRMAWAVATASEVQVWVSDRASPVARIAGTHLDTICDIAWAPDGGLLAVASVDGYVTLCLLAELGSRGADAGPLKLTLGAPLEVSDLPAPLSRVLKVESERARQEERAENERRSKAAKAKARAKVKSSGSSSKGSPAAMAGKKRERPAEEKGGGGGAGGASESAAVGAGAVSASGAAQAVASLNAAMDSASGSGEPASSASSSSESSGAAAAASGTSQKHAAEAAGGTAKAAEASAAPMVPLPKPKPIPAKAGPKKKKRRLAPTMLKP